MRTILKKSDENVTKRDVANQKIEDYRMKIIGMEKRVVEVLDQERFEWEVKKAEMEVTKAQNMLMHKDEIYNRPKK